MNSAEYQELAMRTDATNETAVIGRMDNQIARLNHAALGLAGEVGEFTDPLKKYLMYGKGEMIDGQLKLSFKDKMNMMEELSDIMWYVVLACDALGTNMSEIKRNNIKKLEKRYPEKYFTLERSNTRDTSNELSDFYLCVGGIFHEIYDALKAIDTSDVIREVADYAESSYEFRNKFAGLIMNDCTNMLRMAKESELSAVAVFVEYLSLHDFVGLDGLTTWINVIKTGHPTEYATVISLYAHRISSL